MWPVSKKPVQIQATITCFVYIAQLLEGFLITSKAPLASFLYDVLMEFVKGLMLRCITTEVIERLNTVSAFMKIDLDTNLVIIKKVVVGVSKQSIV